MINVRGLQRNVKNVVKNYTEAQVKVREATSNDPWGPPSTLMAEIADLTHNVVAFSEIMQMIWKRLNDHGKNWRHVYKALSLLDYLIKTGSEKVAQQCKDNIYAIKTLYCFQYIEENKDQGVNVREKSKALVALLSDDEKLRIERERALKAKERFAQSISYMSSSGSGENVVAGSSDAAFKTSRSDTASSGSSAANPDLEKARPQTLGEEELHLRLALAMSKEEAEVEERQRKNDDLRLQLALTESEKEKAKKKASAMDDLLSIELSQPVAEVQSTSQLDVWGAPISGPSASGSSNLNGLELLGAVGPSTTAINNTDDFFSALDSQNSHSSTSQFNSDSDSIWPALSNVKDLQVSNEPLLAQNDPWQPVSSTSATPEPTKVANNDPWSSVPTSKPTTPLSNGTTANRKTPESFLGANFNLVNLDSLIASKTTSNSNLPLGGNPFAPAVTSNPFQAAKPAPLTINQLRSQTSLFPDTKNNGSIAPSASNASNAFGHNSHDFSLNLNASKNPFAI